MTQYRCPDEIAELFDDEKTVTEGRRRAIEWARGVTDRMQMGDEIWMPETGWWTKTGGRA